VCGQENIPEDHRCKYCGLGKKDTVFRISHIRVTSKAPVVYSICKKCMYDRSTKELYSSKGALIKKRIADYFRENY